MAKIVNDEKQFEPVIIILETAEEVSYLRELLRANAYSETKKSTLKHYSHQTELNLYDVMIQASKDRGLPYREEEQFD